MDARGRPEHDTGQNLSREPFVFTNVHRFPMQPGLGGNSRSYIGVPRQAGGRDLAEIEQTIEELRLCVREWQNLRQARTAFSAKGPRPRARVTERSQVVRPYGRNQLNFELPEDEPNLLNRHGSPILAVHPSVDRESQSKPLSIKTAASQEKVRVKEVSTCVP